MANPFKNTENLAKPNSAAQPQPTVEKKTVAKKNPLAGLIDAKPMAKSYAVYLDVDLVDEIDRLAKENKTNRSRIINALLRNAIIGE